MKKIKLEVMCKRNRFDYWNLCKCLPNFVNVAALDADVIDALTLCLLGSLASFLSSADFFQNQLFGIKNQDTIKSVKQF